MPKRSKPRFIPEVYTTRVGDHKDRLDYEGDKDDRKKSQVDSCGQWEVVGCEDQDEQVGPVGGVHKLAEDVNVEHINIKEPHRALSEGKDGEDGADGLRETADHEGDGEVVKDEAVSREVTVPIFQDEPNWRQYFEEIEYLKVSDT